MRRLYLFLILAAVPGPPVFAQDSRDFGSPQEAFWMLERVIGAMRTDQTKALQLFNGKRRLIDPTSSADPQGGLQAPLTVQTTLAVDQAPRSTDSPASIQSALPSRYSLTRA